MAEDTDSDWDSSVLDFSVTPRGPRVIGFNQQPPKEMDAIEETSEHSKGEPHSPLKETKYGIVPRSRTQEANSHTNKGNNSIKEENKKRNSVKNSIDKSPVKHAGSAKDTLNPPYNFRGMCSSDGDNPLRNHKVPGKSRKGNLYDEKPKEVDTPDINLWGDSDEEERILQNVRENFTRPKSSGPVNSSAQKTDSKPSPNQGDVASSPVNRNTNHVNSGEILKDENGYIQTYESNGIGPDFQTVMTVTGVKSPTGSQQAPNDFVKQILIDNGKNGKRYRYYFNHSDMHYFEVEEIDENLIMPRIADTVEKVTGRGLQEMFGCLRMVFICVVLFLVELSKFMFGVILGPVFTGVIGAIGDYLIKPVLAGLFNSFIHPFFTLLYNVFSGLRHASAPILLISREIVNQAALLFRAIRLVQITNTSNKKADDKPRIQEV